MPGVKGHSGGRNAKSTKQHKLEGTYDERRHGGKKHPTPEVGAPKPPSPLKGSALREWKRMVKLLQGSEMLTVVDGAMLYGYCELHGDAEAAKGDLARLRRRTRRRLSMAEELELQKQVARITGQLLRYRQQIRMYLVEFGLSPSARSRVDLSAAGAGTVVGDGELGDEMSEFDKPEPLTLVHSRT